MDMQTHLSVNYREFINADVEESIDSLFARWCTGMRRGDMADNLAVICAARRFRLKLFIWQPPTSEGWDARSTRPKAFRPTVLNENAPNTK